jgi:hypothetical protein
VYLLLLLMMILQLSTEEASAEEPNGPDHRGESEWVPEFSIERGHLGVGFDPSSTAPLSPTIEGLDTVNELYPCWPSNYGNLLDRNDAFSIGISKPVEQRVARATPRSARQDFQI